MKFRQVCLTEYPYQPIKDFSEARNYFLERLPDDEYILFVEHDEEASQILLNFLKVLKPVYPYYAIRIMTFGNGIYRPMMAPYEGRLASNRVRYKGTPEDRAYPRKPYGMIDLPIIHNPIPHGDYGYPFWKANFPARSLMLLRKALDSLRSRRNLVYGYVGH